jgi:hypothetical protein
MIYSIDYFIEKFKAIPRSKWTTRHFEDGDKYCALGHCGFTVSGKQTDEGNALIALFKSRYRSEGVLTNINDGASVEYKQKTPKGRILAALKDLL